MKVLLTADVYKQGVAGEIVEVANGYARNYLIPKKLAVQATPGALKQAEDMRKHAEVRRMQLDARLNDLARLIDGVELIFGKRASPTGKLFGSVTTTEIAEALNEKTGIDINRRRISQQSIREVGTHDVPVRLGNEISPMLKVTVVRQEDLAKFLAARAAEAAASKAPAQASAEAVESVEDMTETVDEMVEDATEVVEEATSGDDAQQPSE